MLQRAGKKVQKYVAHKFVLSLARCHFFFGRLSNAGRQNNDIIINLNMQPRVPAPYISAKKKKKKTERKRKATGYKKIAEENLGSDSFTLAGIRNFPGLPGTHVAPALCVLNGVVFQPSSWETGDWEIGSATLR